MSVERSAGAVVYRDAKRGREYLLLKHPRKEPEPKEYWNFPKGHIEKGETSQEAARRETEEETGLCGIAFIPGFKETERYVYVAKGRKVLKFVVWFIAESKKKRVKISREHSGAAWLPYDRAYERVFYQGSRRLIQKAHRFLEKNRYNKRRESA
ncbi:MAG: NUDIX domain-containing protein [Candidatus Sungbacteria bacterium]|uniref:NUDIX domain-containing protein n=1 Tax=Candidatus Sungiibacteriota bacterium TaxID=2750080 RepID=A0A932R1H2_9BACT|nr:NUDIX domain-containing protein [Candidatus Sungbacteria bacterium]